MENWLVLTLAVVIAARLLATAKPPKGRGSEVAATSSWTPALKYTALAAGATGLFLRLYGFTSSLWGDELGTLWTVESGLPEVIERSVSFHGQSPFFYLISWAFVNLFGESEWVLRLPSLLAVIGAGWLVYRIGATLQGPRAGVYSAIAFWLAFMSLRSTADARPYGLGLFFGALALYGFVQASSESRRRGRVWFVVGGVGLIAAHYLLALMLLGIGLAYLLASSLRENYRLPQFSFDVAAMMLLSAPLFPQVLALWSRRSELVWAPEINYQQVYFTFGPEATLAAAGLAAGAYWQRRAKSGGSFALLSGAMLAPPVVLIVLALMGTNLISSRYMVTALIPACLLAGVGLALLPVRWTYFGWFGWAYLNAVAFFGTYQLTHSFTGAGYQDWRGATAELERRLEQEPGTPVFYRSGFIEDDQRALGHDVSPAMMAPLRSPGQEPPAWNIVPLTYNWPFAQREEYFERVIAPAVDDETTFYYFSCDCASGPPSAGYEVRFAQWVGDRFGGRYAAERLNIGLGMVALRFSAQDTAAMPEAAVSELR